MNASPNAAALDAFVRRHPTVTVVVLLSVVVCSRLLLFPASVWEQDEAYFAAAVVEVDVADSRPHAPFFPLWIGLGKILFRMAEISVGRDLVWKILQRIRALEPAPC